MPILLLLVVGALVLGGWWWSRQQLRNANEGANAVSRVLDAADALEQEIRDLRGTAAAADPDVQASLESAMRDMLRQRLWLQEHGVTADTATLVQIRNDLEAVTRRLREQRRRGSAPTALH